MQITLQPGQPVAVIALDRPEAGAGTGRILEISGRYAHVESDLSLQMDQPVQVEWVGHVLLGEVVAIVKTAPARVITLEIRHVVLEHAQAAAS